ncbi:hypothetical protein CBER1_06091 [Cercospora berteroae]|uniref:RBR-type E3 ubiquitin transferase n=1 Tax=Cercospora berteroae TaxID=357750 RepID=A0A2S6C5E6_9PEZI|nr:hypothetical protein CBER1_06091 [Cercospora berteroae]
MENRLQQDGPSHHQFVRTMKGAVVHFRPGVTVSNISLISNRTPLSAPPSVSTWAQKRHIKLTEEGFRRTMCGGMNTLIWTAFPERVLLDEAKKEIVVLSCKDTYQRVLNALSGSLTFGALVHPQQRGLCNICYTEAGDPVVTECGHFYCRQCLENMCNVRNPTLEFKIVCRGNFDRCRTPLSITTIQDLLPPDAFERVLETSLDMYIRRHPREYHCCPTPNCGHIFRPSPVDHAAVHSAYKDCKNCNRRICTACKTVHWPKTCSQHRDDERSQQWRQENSDRVKDCPSCGNTLEKNGGCDHMVCHCGAHICWSCRAIYTQEEQIYGHNCPNADHTYYYDYAYDPFDGHDHQANMFIPAPPALPDPHPHRLGLMRRMNAQFRDMVEALRLRGGTQG